jgi:prepilin-type N-terminal cleavage/methylation domain-containing protein
MINFKLQKKRGFTLVETLVAISILMVSIAGPMVLVGNGIRSSAFARDQVTAFYLAQDAIEAMRYIRDNNRIEKVTSSNPDSVEWDALTTYTCSSASPCGIDTVKIYNGLGGAISTDNDAKELSIDSQGRYGYDASGSPTIFRRWITINPAVGNENKEVEIVVTVDWSSGIIRRTFSIRENLFYWY